jgi:hypothetical protein
MALAPNYQVSSCSPKASYLTTREHRGRGEKDQPKVGPKGEWSGNDRVKGHREHKEDFKAEKIAMRRGKRGLKLKPEGAWGAGKT